MMTTDDHNANDNVYNGEDDHASDDFDNDDSNSDKVATIMMISLSIYVPLQ